MFSSLPKRTTFSSHLIWHGGPFGKIMHFYVAVGYFGIGKRA